MFYYSRARLIDVKIGNLNLAGQKHMCFLLLLSKFLLLLLSLPQDGWSQIYTLQFDAATFYCNGWWWRSHHEVAVMWCDVVRLTAITVYVSD